MIKLALLITLFLINLPMRAQPGVVPELLLSTREAAYVMNVETRATKLIAERAAWSPNSEYLFWREAAETGQRIWIKASDDSDARLLFETSGSVGLYWSPNGEQIALDVVYLNEQGLERSQMWLTGVDEMLLRLRLEVPRFVRLNWSPDGERLAWTEHAPTLDTVSLHVMDANGANQRPLLEFNRPQSWSWEWSADNRQIALQQVISGYPENHTLAILDVSDGSVNSLHRVFEAVWSPDGSMLGWLRGTSVQNAVSTQVGLTGSFGERLLVTTTNT